MVRHPSTQDLAGVMRTRNKMSSSLRNDFEANLGYVIPLSQKSKEGVMG